ncbi:hypothetical protein CLOM_g16916 [Closterium sp. NIES-68]|nr:hypothetical protein CLOM_g16916 [Closterium sp. NIES-68]GJP65437.1 hypothetical protein CLOP_g22313 [Closterium sp. NIES-67]
MGNSCSAASAVWATDENLRIDASTSKYSHHRVTRFAQRHAKTADRRPKKVDGLKDGEDAKTADEGRGSDGSPHVAGKGRNAKPRSLRDGSQPRKIEQKLLMRGAYSKMADAAKAAEAEGSLEAKYHLGKWLGSGKHGSVRVCWPKEQSIREQPEQSISFSSPLPCSSSMSPLSSSPLSPFGFEALSPGLSSNGVCSPSPASSPSPSLSQELIAGGVATVAQRFACKSIAKVDLPRLVSAGSSSSSSSSAASSSRSTSRDSGSNSRSSEGGGAPANLERCATAKKEVEVLERLQGHPGVVRLYDVVDDAQHTHIVMQLCQGPSLKDRIAQKGTMSEREAARVMRSVVGVLAYCHDRGIVHRDVKDCNFIFLSNDPASPLVAIDFGLATFYSPDKRLHEVAGSPCFVAPEVLRVRGGGGYGPGADVWSAGVLLHLLLAGRVPFDGVTIMDVFRAVASAPLDLTSPPLQSLSPEAKDLLALVLTRDVTKRPSARDVLCHPWMMQDSDASSH